MNIVNFISKINKTNTIIYDAINMKQTYYKILNSHKSSMLNCECFKILEEYKDLNINIDIIDFMKYSGLNLRSEQYLSISKMFSGLYNTEFFGEIKDSTLVFPRHYGRNNFLYNLYNYCKL